MSEISGIIPEIVTAREFFTDIKGGYKTIGRMIAGGRNKQIINKLNNCLQILYSNKFYNDQFYRLSLENLVIG